MTGDVPDREARSIGIEGVLELGREHDGRDVVKDLADTLISREGEHGARTTHQDEEEERFRSRRRPLKPKFRAVQGGG